MLKEFYPTIQGMVYSILFFILGLVVMMKKPITYLKMNWLQFILLELMSFMAVMVAISIHANEMMKTILLSMMLSGILLISMVAVAVMSKYPTFLK